MSSGGKRAGAGRKRLPAHDRPVAITVRVRPFVASRFADLCAGSGLSQAKKFSALVAVAHPPPL